ncbi:spindle pole body component [Scheffersomyces coipomensis]|uniref:spindle pole body component n=1 Tax=Scheffersomyces coipomensis TaxID=1788519 RepID=UPI00315DD975
MALDKSQLVKLYTGRLVKSLVPAEFGDEFIQSITSDLLSSISKTISNQSSSSSSSNRATIHEINQLTNQYRVYFVSKGLQAEWVKFQTILESLQSFKSLDQIFNYLVFFDALQQGGRNINVESSPQVNQRIISESIRSTNLRSSPFRESSKNSKEQQQQQQQYHQLISLDKLIEPYYQTLPEETIIKYLSYSLIGLDSKLLSFSNNSKQIVIPTSINNSYSGLLFQILECGLLYKNLSTSYELYNKQGDKLKSPIKVAYIQIMQSYLLQYVKDINEIFNINNCSSLLEIYNLLYKNWVYELRLLYSIVNELDTVNGLDLLIKVYELIKFGDLKIQSLSLTIFKEIIKPYNEILENWLINGELVDLNNEFFITFDLEQDEFNDIIKFLPNRIPKFINKNLGFKIYQIGKMLIFLLKYCRELEWINQYRNKYNQLIYKLASPTDGEILSVSNDKFQKLINQQYEELLNYVTIILYGSKNNLIENLINFKRLYFIENEDFINQIILKGGEFFNNLKFNLNLNYLSQILEESIKHSSMNHFKHRDRIDFRILNNQANTNNNNNNNNIGWEVFIIDFKLDGLSISHLFDSKTMIQYCKMFNFLWKLRHLQSMLNENFMESISLNKNELRGINEEYKRLKRTTVSTVTNIGLSVRERKIIWIIKSFNSINLIRNKMIQFLQVIINYLSFDLIENKFQIELVEKLFKSNKVSKSSDFELVKNLNSKFINKLINETRNNDVTVITDNNMNELTIDEILSIHEQYLYQIIKNKLINENSMGKVTRKSYIKQIYELLDIIFQFIISSKEYFNLITNYILLLKLEEQEENADEEEDMTNEVDQDLLNIENLLQNIINKIYKQIYLKDYKLTVNEFIQDLRTDYELKDLSKLF